MELLQSRKPLILALCSVFGAFTVTTLSLPALAQTAETAASAPPSPSTSTPEPVPAAAPDRALSNASYTSAAHDELVVAQRSGRVSAAAGFAQLAVWHAQTLDPVARQRVVSDGVVWAMAAGRPAESARWAREAPVDTLAAYAVLPAFQAARTVADRPLEADAVRLMRSREPDAWQPRIYEALWLTDTGEFAQAESALNALAAAWAAPTVDQRVALLEARGALDEARNRPLDALAHYNALLALQPGHRYATRTVSFMLGASGAEAAALKHAEDVERASPGSFSAFELANLRQQALGQQLRWAIADRAQSTGWGAARFASLDAVLPRYHAELDAATAREARARADGDAASADVWKRLRLQLSYDRIVALQERARYAEVTQAYDGLLADGVAPPYYVLSAVAGAWQQQRRSDLAVPMYEAALRDGGEQITMPSDTHVGLVYAYLDTARFEQAEALLDQMEAATPPMLRLTPTPGTSNAEYGEVRNLRALSELYTGQTARAERTAGALSAVAPLNAGFRSAEAETALARQHPDAALAHYEELLTDHPDSLQARAGYAGALFDAGELRAGHQLVDALEAEAPDSIAVRNAVRLRNATLAPRLEVDADAGKDGGALANREWRVDSRLISPWFGDDEWRLFYHQVLAHADTDAGNVTLARAGLGVEWLRGRWNLTGEVHQANDGPYRTGVALGVRYRASDNWRLFATVDTNSLDTPWKARNAGIGAYAAEGGATYVVNESRSFEGTAQRMDYSDGNARDALGLTWRERWLSTARWQLESTLGAETARTDRQETPYFSPARESAVQAGLSARYLTWKRDDRSLAQVVELTAGRYEQQGFGSGPMWSLRYGHEWSFGPTMLLRYGLGVSSHPYDGVKERRPFVFLSLSVPLQ
ncbi:hypothetical protein BH10PSE18_BH10PSE18_38060 [soil metagenome]